MSRRDGIPRDHYARRSRWDDESLESNGPRRITEGADSTYRGRSSSRYQSRNRSYSWSSDASYRSLSPKSNRARFDDYSRRPSRQYNRRYRSLSPDQYVEVIDDFPRRDYGRRYPVREAVYVPDYYNLADNQDPFAPRPPRTGPGLPSYYDFQPPPYTAQYSAPFRGNRGREDTAVPQPYEPDVPLGNLNTVAGTGREPLRNIDEIYQTALRPSYNKPLDSKGAPLKFDVRLTGEWKSEVKRSESGFVHKLRRARVETIFIGSSRGYNNDDGMDTVVLVQDIRPAPTKGAHIKWTHCQHEDMNFKALQETIMYDVGLSSEDVLLAVQLIAQVQGNYEKEFFHGYYLEPLVLRCDGIQASADILQERHCTFVSFPYLANQFAAPTKGKDGTQQHPIRGLLQTLYSLESTKARDMDQVVSRFRSKKSSVYVPQLWAIIFDSDTLITCSSSSLAALQGGNIQIKQPISTIRTGPSVIRVTDPEGRLYFFSVDQCKTWFELNAILSSQCLPRGYQTLDQFQVTLKDGRVPRAATWTNILATETASFIDMTITSRSNDGRGYRIPNYGSGPYTPFPLRPNQTANMRYDDSYMQLRDEQRLNDAENRLRRDFRARRPSFRGDSTRDGLTSTSLIERPLRQHLRDLDLAEYRSTRNEPPLYESTLSRPYQNALVRTPTVTAMNETREQQLKAVLVRRRREEERDSEDRTRPRDLQIVRRDKGDGTLVTKGFFEELYKEGADNVIEIFIEEEMSEGKSLERVRYEMYGGEVVKIIERTAREKTPNNVKEDAEVIAVSRGPARSEGSGSIKSDDGIAVTQSLHIANSGDAGPSQTQLTEETRRVESEKDEISEAISRSALAVGAEAIGSDDGDSWDTVSSSSESESANLRSGVTDAVPIDKELSATGGEDVNMGVGNQMSTVPEAANDLPRQDSGSATIGRPSGFASRSSSQLQDLELKENPVGEHGEDRRFGSGSEIEENSRHERKGSDAHLSEAGNYINGDLKDVVSAGELSQQTDRRGEYERPASSTSSEFDLWDEFDPMTAVVVVDQEPQLASESRIPIRQEGEAVGNGSSTALNGPRNDSYRPLGIPAPPTYPPPNGASIVPNGWDETEERRQLTRVPFIRQTSVTERRSIRRNSPQRDDMRNKDIERRRVTIRSRSRERKDLRKKFTKYDYRGREDSSRERVGQGRIRASSYERKRPTPIERRGSVRNDYWYRSSSLDREPIEIRVRRVPSYERINPLAAPIDVEYVQNGTPRYLANIPTIYQPLREREIPIMPPGYILNDASQFNVAQDDPVFYDPKSDKNVKKGPSKNINIDKVTIDRAHSSDRGRRRILPPSPSTSNDSDLSRFVNTPGSSSFSGTEGSRASSVVHGEADEYRENAKLLPILMWPTQSPDVEDTSGDMFSQTRDESMQQKGHEKSRPIQQRQSSQPDNAAQSFESLAEVLERINERLCSDSEKDHAKIYRSIGEAQSNELKFFATGGPSRESSNLNANGDPKEKSVPKPSSNMDSDKHASPDQSFSILPPDCQEVLTQFSNVSTGLLTAFAPPFDHVVLRKYNGAMNLILEIFKTAQEHYNMGEKGRAANPDSKSILWIVQDQSPIHQPRRLTKPELDKPLSDCPRCSAATIYETQRDVRDHLRSVHFSKAGESKSPSNSVLSRWIKKLDRIADQRRFEEQMRVLRACHTHLIRVEREASQIQIGMATHDSNHPGFFRLPKDFVLGFRSLLLVLLYTTHILQMIDKKSTTTERRDWRWNPARDDDLLNASAHLERLGEDAREALVKGKMDVQLMITARDFTRSVTYQAVGPQYILAIMLGNMQRGVETQDLLETYKDYTEHLAFQVSQRPRRRLLRDFLALSEEIGAICATLETQDRVLKDYNSVLAPSSFRITTRTRHSLYGLEFGLLSKSSRSIGKEIAQYTELKRQVDRQIALTKMGVEILDDDHGKAILVFTVVTLVFLPLSFVTSYMGMNTSDIRNQDAGQGRFWMIAAPLTSLVLGLALLLGYRFETLREWAGKWKWGGPRRADTVHIVSNR